jgi:hypothetical protein
MSTIGLNELGYDQRLYMLAFDHRGSFEKMVGFPARGRGGSAEELRSRPGRREVRAERRE